MSTNEQTPLSQPTSVVRNTLGKEPVLQDPGRLISDDALPEYYDRNYHQILPIIAEKVHLEKVQQEKLKAVKAVSILRKPHVILSQEHQSKEGVSRKGSDQDMSAADLETTQGVSHTTVAAGTLKVATKALIREQQSPLKRRYTKRASSRRTE
ncbi:hypothetical protein Tco_0911147 [Tanacetum coccineum]|uniref:Reverse transcriptase domain-containing protein n=1 Tax=Tanacetum coccineum TaxID=301880 RepID=A0ABQ5CXL6_9ASTR